MVDFQELAIQEALRSALGGRALFWHDSNTNRFPNMKFVLDEAARQIRSPFSVYWVEGSPPEAFCLPGFSPSPVVLSTRYLLLSAFLRNLWMEEREIEILVDVTERTALQVIAEMALHHGDREFAVFAFVKSVIRNTGIGLVNWLSHAGLDRTLSDAPVTEASIAVSFYGLLHELGHLHSEQMRQHPEGHFLSDPVMLDDIMENLNKLPWLDSVKKHEAIEKAKQGPSVLATSRLRSESIADVFAANVLFKTSFEIIQTINQQRFDLQKFIREIVILPEIVHFIDTCRRTASAASMETTKAARDVLLESAVYPLAISYRASIQRNSVASMIATYLADVSPISNKYESIQKLFDKISEHYSKATEAVDRGLAEAIKFCLVAEGRENHWTLVDVFRKELRDFKTGLLEAQRFCKMADELGVEGELLQALMGVMHDPRKPLGADPISDLMYYVPWLHGPNGPICPFGLDTKYGHVVFGFHTEKLYDALFQRSAEMVKAGFKIEKTVLYHRRNALPGSIQVENMPDEQSVGLIVEGSEVFSRYMKELADNTIWENNS